jgi:hypothetical protein
MNINTKANNTNTSVRGVYAEKKKEMRVKESGDRRRRICTKFSWQ